MEQKENQEQGVPPNNTKKPKRVSFFEKSDTRNDENGPPRLPKRSMKRLQKNDDQVPVSDPVPVSNEQENNAAVAVSESGPVNLAEEINTGGEKPDLNAVQIQLSGLLMVPDPPRTTNEVSSASGAEGSATKFSNAVHRNKGACLKESGGRRTQARPEAANSSLKNQANTVAPKLRSALKQAGTRSGQIVKVKSTKHANSQHSNHEERAKLKDSVRRRLGGRPKPVLKCQMTEEASQASRTQPKQNANSGTDNAEVVTTGQPMMQTTGELTTSSSKKQAVVVVPKLKSALKPPRPQKVTLNEYMHGLIQQLRHVTFQKNVDVHFIESRYDVQESESSTLRSRRRLDRAARMNSRFNQGRTEVHESKPEASQASTNQSAAHTNPGAGVAYAEVAPTTEQPKIHEAGARATKEQLTNSSLKRHAVAPKPMSALIPPAKRVKINSCTVPKKRSRSCHAQIQAIVPETKPEVIEEGLSIQNDENADILSEEVQNLNLAGNDLPIQPDENADIPIDEVNNLNLGEDSNSEP